MSSEQSLDCAKQYASAYTARYKAMTIAITAGNSRPVSVLHICIYTHMCWTGHPGTFDGQAWHGRLPLLTDT